MKTYFQWFFKGTLTAMSGEKHETTRAALAEREPNEAFFQNPLKVNEDIVLAKVTVEPMKFLGGDDWEYVNEHD